MKPCWPSQIDRGELDRAMTPERVSAIWRYAKEMHIDKGVPMEEAIGKVGAELGMPKEVVAYAFTKPKSLRPFVAELYRQQSYRRDAVRQAKTLVKTLDTPAFEKYVSQGFHFRRTLLTSGHFGVFPVTHAGDLAMRFSSMPLFLKTAYKSWMRSGRIAHEAAMTELRASERFDFWKRAGALIDPEAQPEGILMRGMSGRSRRAFDFLKVAQYELMEKAWAKAGRSGYEQNIDLGKVIADWGNKATGRTSGKVFLSKLQFAPQLTASKWIRAVVDPIRTVKTVYDVAVGKPVPAADRFIAAHRTRMATEFVVTYGSFLALNQLANEALGSKDKINFTDPSRSDFLAFKVHGHVLGVGSGVLEVYRLLGALVAVGQMTVKQRHGDTAVEAQAKRVGRYAMYKAEPTLGGIAEALSRSDVLTGRPLPWSRDKGTPARPKMGAQEYALTHFAPIPIAGVMREAYDTMRKEGADPSDITKLLKTAWRVFYEGGAFEAGGFKYHPYSEPKKG